MKVCILMGSKSDFPTMEKAIKVLKNFGVAVDVRVLSAHRTPNEIHELMANAENNHIDLFIAGAGKAAHLAGVVAAFTTLPVIGVPIKSSTMDGLDSLLSMVQMPAGIPVATVAIDGAENAGLLAVQILALKHSGLKAKLKDHKVNMAKKVLDDDASIQVLVDAI
jgi:5-(carboxyamino)imidazole ribonucleotide mutase